MCGRHWQGAGKGSRLVGKVALITSWECVGFLGGVRWWCNKQEMLCERRADTMLASNSLPHLSVSLSPPFPLYPPHSASTSTC